MKIKFLNEAVDKDTGHIDPSPKNEAEVKDLKDKDIQPIAEPDVAAATASIQSNKDNADKAIKSSNNTKNGEDLAKELGGDRTKAPKTPKMKPYTEGLEDDDNMTLDDYFNKNNKEDNSSLPEGVLNEWLVGTRGFLTELKMVIKDGGGIDKKEYDSAEDWANVIWYDDPYNVTIPKAWCAEYGVDYENLTEEALDDYWEQEIWGEHQAEIKALYDGAASLTESKKSSLKIKDRKELAQHIIEARKNNKKWKISRCLEEGYRYLFEEEDGEVRITNDLEWEALADKISKNISNRVYELEDNLATSLVSEVPGYNNEWCANDSNIDCIEDLNKSREQFIHDITTCMLINSDWTKHINEAKKNNKNTPTNEKIDSCESGECTPLKEGTNSEKIAKAFPEFNRDRKISTTKDDISDLTAESLNESQSQEIVDAYNHLSKEYGVDMDSLSAEYQKANPHPDFHGDIIFNKVLWNKFVDWLKDVKGICIDAKCTNESLNESIDYIYAQKMADVMKAKKMPCDQIRSILKDSGVPEDKLDDLIGKKNESLNEDDEEQNEDPDLIPTTTVNLADPKKEDNDEDKEINVDDLADYKPAPDEAPAFTSIKEAGQGTMAAFEDTLKDLYDVQIKVSQLHDLLTKDASWLLDMLGIGDTKDIPEPIVTDTKADSALPAEASFGDEDEPVVEDEPTPAPAIPSAPKENAPVTSNVPLLDDGEPVPLDMPDDDPEAQRAALAAKLKASTGK